MAGTTLWDKFRYANQPKKRFRPSSDDKNEDEASQESKDSSSENRNSFDCLTKPAGRMTPDPDSCQGGFATLLCVGLSG